MCTGYGGLDMAAVDLLGGTPAWFADNDPAASKVLEHHWPGVPNLGDITAVDWSAVEPVDGFTGGTPCQDLSNAGKRAGMRAGTRSGLWHSMCDAIKVLRPRLVLWENVRGALSARADSAVERCSGCVGDGDDGPVLRALGRVLGDLAGLGYDAVWCGLPAAAVGCAHLRWRVFVAAADTRRDARPEDLAHGTTAAGGGRAAAADADRSGLRQQPEPIAGGGGASLAVLARTDRTAAHADGGERDGREPGALGNSVGRASASGRGEVAAADASSDGWREGGAEPAGQFWGSDAAQRGGVVGADAERDGRQRGEERDGEPGQPEADDEHDGQDAERLRVAAVDWREYGAAIRQHERMIGRAAPVPTIVGKRGGPKLSPYFTEWLMGLPAGHVTAVPGLSVNDQLRLCGNGVVRQQAVAAYRYLLPHLFAEGRWAA